jgi:hypothetical protein
MVRVPVPRTISTYPVAYIQKIGAVVIALNDTADRHAYYIQYSIHSQHLLAISVADPVGSGPFGTGSGSKAYTQIDIFCNLF